MRNRNRFSAMIGGVGKCGVGALALLAAVAFTGIGSSVPSLETAAWAAGTTTTLPADQAAAIQQSVQTALANINPALTGAARDQAIAQALAQATSQAIATYGANAIAVVTGAALTAGVPAQQVVAAVLPAAANPNSGVPVATAVSDIQTGAASAGASSTVVAEATIAVAAQNQLSADQVGSGLGEAAAIISQTNPSAANQIAQVVSNEGTSGMGQSFAQSVVANGGSQQLASAGTQNPSATGSTNQNNQGNNNQGNHNNNNNQGNNQQGSGGTSLPPCSNPSCT